MRNTEHQPVTVVVGATSKWRADGEGTVLAGGHPVEPSQVPVGQRWGVGGAIAQRFAREGHFVVLTTRQPTRATDLVEEIEAQSGTCMTVELDLGSKESIDQAFDTIRAQAGDPDVLIYNAGYLAGRALAPDQELLENFPDELFDVAQAVAVRGPFLVAKQVLPAMREKGSGSFFFSNNASSLRGRKRRTGESLYYPRTMMRTLAQVLTDEYSEFGIHAANVVIDGIIDSPGTRGHLGDDPHRFIDPVAIADAFHYLYSQDRSCWTHELQLTPSTAAPAT